jgi:acyl-CoA synthetase (AMP-forming)/AMP-acid ligase II
VIGAAIAAVPLIISGGENIHPVQVEAVLKAHPMIADSLVVGLPDQR